MRNKAHLILPVLFAIALAFLLQHFVGSIAWAGLLAVITWPLHQRLLRRGWAPLASASFMLLLLIVSFVGPSVLLFHTLTYELASLQRMLISFNQTGVPVPDWLANLPLVAEPAVKWWLEHLAVPGGLNALVRTTVGDFMPHLTDTARVWGSTILANALYLFLTLLTLFVLYVHGSAVMHYIDRAGARLLPDQYTKLRRVLPLSVRGTALGLGSIAILEGIVLGVAYWVAGAPAPVLLGVITGYLALIPGGAPLSFTMVSLLLFGQGHSAEALGLFTWGAVELFLVDKFIRPKLIGQRVNLPFLAVLFGLLGGVSTLGVIGLFVGPLMMAILFGWLRDEPPGTALLTVPPPQAPATEASGDAERMR
ncbi:AI-2E family transporter [Massilia sp. CFBP9012]|uniref:AI-2E family transporter n=1 Tax=Massilia arenae TaxID=2603288 RepID=A0A5C7G0J4_9BURK|nr:MULTISPECIES: AI-2E family transporter [Massilia]MDY0977034.1 AI-2E family transporter [Massilia sp. CFBP9012]TXF97140.1 AI-2E family transporter [Massilia arenae]